MTMIVVKGVDNLLANTANLLVQSISTPFDTTVIDYDPPTETTAPRRGGPSFTTDAATRKAPKRNQLVVPPTFKLALVAVICLTAFAGIAQACMAAFWLSPTSMQQATFDGMGSVWKLGFGALLGLIGGKSAK